MADKTQDHAGVKILPPKVLFACVLASLCADFLYPLPFDSGVAGRIAGVLLGVFGIVVMSWSAGLLVKHGSNIPPNQPTTALVFDGLYRFSRNPIYIAFLLCYLSLALLFDSLWFICFAVPLWGFLRYGVIAREEAYLERKFGVDYLNYKQRVRRWI